MTRVPGGLVTSLATGANNQAPSGDTSVAIEVCLIIILFIILCLTCNVGIPL
jgi:hypothetical protein